MKARAKKLAILRPRRRLSLIVVPIIVAVLIVAGVLLYFLTPLPKLLFPGKKLQVRIGQSRFDYPPLHYYEGETLTGFDVELARAAAELMGAEIEFVPIDWSEALEALESGDVDILWGGLERASLDERVVKFTSPYLRSNIVLLMPEDRDYAAFEDLQNLSICALNFTPAFNYVQVYNRDIIKSRRSFTPPEYQALMNSLSSGEFDCMVTDTSFASFFLSENGDGAYKMSDTVISSNYAAGVRIGDTDLFELLQNALDELTVNGTVDRLREKWLG